MKCSNCGEQISVTDEFCPYCNSKNINFINKENDNSFNEKNVNEKVYNTNLDPRTIEELKEWYKARNLPPEDTTRFFIGRDYIGAKAFGIYKDEISGEFIVYKNKADGSRAIRYKGKDEEYAVSELLAKLKEEIINQKERNNSKNNDVLYNSFTNNSSRSRKKSYSIRNSIIAVLGSFFVTMILPLLILFKLYVSPGYYNYNGDYYYNQRGAWYIYINDSNNYGEYETNGWKPINPPEELKKNYKKYYVSEYYQNDYIASDFSDSSYYIPPSTSSSYDDDDDYSSSSYDWDDDDDWDWDSSDWDSDW